MNAIHYKIRDDAWVVSPSGYNVQVNIKEGAKELIGMYTLERVGANF